MNASTTVRRLAEAIGQATRSAKFCVAGRLPAVDPGIEVDGLGAIKLPLKPATAKKLVARCRVAPYGKRTQTLGVEGGHSPFPRSAEMLIATSRIATDLKQIT